MRIILSALIVLLFSCNDVSNKPHVDDSINGGLHPSVVPVQTDFTKDTMFTIAFPRDSSSLAVMGRLAGIHKPVTALIPVTKGNILSARLVPEDSTANIRINQVFMPGGKADGPFGKTVDIKISDPGIYKLIIGENLMQGEEWKGRFTLLVSVK